MSYAEDFGYDYWGPGDDIEMVPHIDFTEGQWTDGNLKDWKIKDMGHRHISNCIRALKRSKTKWDYPEEEIKEIDKKITEFEIELKQRHTFTGEAF